MRPYRFVSASDAMDSELEREEKAEKERETKKSLDPRIAKAAIERLAKNRLAAKRARQARRASK